MRSSSAAADDSRRLRGLSLEGGHRRRIVAGRQVRHGFHLEGLRRTQRTGAARRYHHQLCRVASGRHQGTHRRRVPGGAEGRRVEHHRVGGRAAQVPAHPVQPFLGRPFDPPHLAPGGVRDDQQHLRVRLQRFGPQPVEAGEGHVGSLLAQRLLAGFPRLVRGGRRLAQEVGEEGTMGRVPPSVVTCTRPSSVPAASVPSRRGDSEMAVVVAYFDIALLSTPRSPPGAQSGPSAATRTRLPSRGSTSEADRKDVRFRWKSLRV
jgi:hypothetical protein